MMSAETFDPRPARFPETIAARAPRGLRERAKLAAEAEQVPFAEFVRRAISERIEAVSRAANDDGGPDPFRPAPGMRAAA